IEGVGAALLFRRSRQAFIALLKLYMSLGLLYLPWAVVVVCCWHDRAGKWIPAPVSIGRSAGKFLQFAFNNSSSLLALTCGVWGIGIVQYLRATRWQVREMLRSATLLAPTWLLLWWLVVPFLVVYSVSLVKPIFVPRYLQISLSAVYLLLARAFTQSLV